MNGTLQHQAIEDAKILRQFADRLTTLANDFTAFKRRSDKFNYPAIWQALPTAAWAADGSPAAADNSPVPTHPITVEALGFAANDLIGMLYAVNQTLVFLQGGTQDAVNQYERINSLLDS